MKKLRLLSFLGLLFTSVSLLAQTEQEARTVAMKFLQQKKGGASLRLTSAKLMDGQAVVTKARGKSANAQVKGGDVYAFNAEGGGFAVVCTGNGNTAVAGYSDKGKVDVTCMPDAMKEWLASYSVAMTSTKEDFVQEPTWVGPTVTPVAPLLKTQWGQGAPFNGKCPSNGKKTTLAGCVPVALAQVLNYYRSDHKGTGQLYYSHQEAEMEYNIDYTNVSYDWGNMLNTYEEGKYSQAQADAVAKLMVECGVASKAKYDYNATSANTPFVALNKYYGFDCMLVDRDIDDSPALMTHNHYRVSTMKWMKLIQNELEQGRPIIYSGSDLNHGNYLVKPVSSHCFVIDGIDAQNYVHCNWGWYGFDDGYYDVALLNPASMEFNYENGYRCTHEMIIGIKPRNGDYEEAVYQTTAPADHYDGGGGAVKSRSNNGESVTGSKMHFFVTANTYDDKETGVAIVLAREGEIKQVVSSYKETAYGWPYYTHWKFYMRAPISVEDGTYDMRLAYYPSDNAAEMKLCPMPELLIPTVDIINDGKAMVFHGLEDEDLVDTLTIESITPVSEILAGTKFYMAVKGTGGIEKVNAYLDFKNVETGKVYGAYNGGYSSCSFKHTYDGYTSSNIFSFNPLNSDNGFTMPAGRYKVELKDCSDNEEVALGGDFYIDVKERPEYPILDGSDKPSISLESARYASQWKEDLARGYAILENTNWGDCLDEAYPSYTYANKVEEPVTVKVYMVNRDTGEKTIIAEDKEWVPKKAIPLKMYTYPLTGNYYFICAYETPDGERGGLYSQDDEPEKWFYYSIINGSSNSSMPKADLLSWKADSIGGKNHIYIKMKLPSSWGLRNINGKALFYDLAKEELTASMAALFPKWYEPGTEFTLPFSQELTKGSKYIVRFMLGDSSGFYRYICDGAERILEINIDENGSYSTGISSISIDNKMFKDKEIVKVYDQNGILVKTVIANSTLWTILQSQLPSGIYVLKSSSKTIKFRK